MNADLSSLETAISNRELPHDFHQLFGQIWNPETGRFEVQETYILDFKQDVPVSLSEPYGVGIARLALAFYNTYGGLIIFGIQDKSLDIVGTTRPFDIEKFNRMLTDIAGINIECLVRNYVVKDAAGSKTVTVVLVPKRGVDRPASLIRDHAQYSKGTTWLRDRHEVIVTTMRNLPLLYSDRRNPPSSNSENPLPVHRSLPPPPATLRHFVEREALAESLWNWFVLQDQPRLYLHGPGGSGKSTLAYEFAKTLAEVGHDIRFKDDSKLDYVIFISGKETEFNSQTRKQQPYALRQFGSANEQFAQIAFHTGFLNGEELKSVTDAEVEASLSELFDHFSGLIVIDDIDALSRKAIDTGEETLFIKAIKGRKRTRILYTLRHPPDHAVKSALRVPGLNHQEFNEFVDACCEQFDVPKPSGENLVQISEVTHSLPLLIENIIWLRKFTGNYRDAVDNFKNRGGDEARRYLYQREYDRLNSQGKSRQLLAGLQLIGEPVTYETLVGFFQLPREQLLEAISECSSIFLTTVDDGRGETQYQLSPACGPFIERISAQLSYYNALKTKVQHFRTAGGKSNAREAALISSADKFIRQNEPAKAVELSLGLKKDDLIFENPRFRSVLGQAYAALGSDYREKARECFKHAEGLGLYDIRMFRTWYYLEFTCGYGLSEAERICHSVINNNASSAQHKSEFYSKLGNCLSHRAIGIIGSSPEKCISLLRQSISSYLEAVWIGRASRTFDVGKTLTWLEIPLARFISLLRDTNIDEYFGLLESLVEKRHDVDPEAIDLVLSYLARAKLPNSPRNRDKLKALGSRTIGRINRTMRPLQNYPGFQRIVHTIEIVQKHLEE